MVRKSIFEVEGCPAEKIYLVEEDGGVNTITTLGQSVLTYRIGDNKLTGRIEEA